MWIETDGVRCVENIPLEFQRMSLHDRELLGYAPIDGKVAITTKDVSLARNSRERRNAGRSYCGVGIGERVRVAINNVMTSRRDVAGDQCEAWRGPVGAPAHAISSRER